MTNILSKQFMFILFQLVGIAGLIFLFGCGEQSSGQSENYLGKSRSEILQDCEHYTRYPFPGDNVPKILIGTGIGYRYFDTIADAEKDDWLMEQPLWTINFRQGQKGIRKGLYFYSVSFNDQGIVTKQSESFMSDF